MIMRPLIRSMTMEIRLRAAVACIVAFTTLAPGYSVCQSTSQTSASPQDAALVLDRAVAVVNKHVILSSDLDDEIRLSILEPNQSGGQLTPQQALAISGSRRAKLLPDALCRAFPERALSADDLTHAAKEVRPSPVVKNGI